MSREPCYLGDGVYADTDGYGGLVLTTGTHERASADNVIVLEAEVLAALIQWIARARRDAGDIR